MLYVSSSEATLLFIQSVYRSVRNAMGVKEIFSAAIGDIIICDLEVGGYKVY